MIRSFVAIDIPELSELTVLLDRLKKSGSRISVPKTEGIHITLKFLGDIEERGVDRIVEALKEVSAKFAPFDAKVTGTGVFPNPRNPRVFWVGIDDGGAISTIAKAVEEKMVALGFEAEKRGFTPHVTVARVKSPAGIDRAQGILREYERKEFGSFRTEDLRFKKSTLTPEGSIYEDLGIIPLSSCGPSHG